MVLGQVQSGQISTTHIQLNFHFLRSGLSCYYRGFDLGSQPAVMLPQLILTFHFIFLSSLFIESKSDLQVSCFPHRWSGERPVHDRRAKLLLSLTLSGKWNSASKKELILSKHWQHYVSISCLLRQLKRTKAVIRMVFSYHQGPKNLNLFITEWTPWCPL